MNITESTIVREGRQILLDVGRKTDTSVVAQYIVDNNNAFDAPYHNIYHTACVAQNTMDGMLFYNSPKNETRSAVIAAMFHDMNHSAGEEDDLFNVETAIEEFKKFYKLGLIDNEKISKETIIECIKYTTFYKGCFPFSPADSIFTSSCAGYILRDADLLQIKEKYWFEMIMLGLREEVQKHYGTMLSLAEFADDQIKFIENHFKFFTPWGKMQFDSQRVKQRVSQLRFMALMDI